MRRIWLSLLLALVCVGGVVPTVMADDQWCSTDPAVVIKTPGGNTVVVHVTNYALGTEHEAAVRAATITHTVQAAPGPATDVTIQVTVPNDQYATGFPTRTVASTHPWGAGTVLATAEGISGQVMTLSFRLDVP